ncbi:hypothetical protein CIHG_03611 [Coccidioides immitis H538.4]|uniref:Uncharacterized protein n=1 Tax=Coccidioides immitis H538.4 TaxID=396776 RepID=A0A0J8RK76_COCIT|nr:hypothetical protein CIHG_03611 [Coccidioides immitis H538.4]
MVSYFQTPTIPPSILVHRWSEEESLPTLQSAPLAHNVEPHGSDSVQSDTTAEESSEDELEESVGFALNQHLLEATAARERGADVPLDDVWEQWLKDAIERGSYEDILHTIREGSVDFSRAFTSPTSIYGNNSAGARQVGPRLMPAPNTALASGFDVSDPRSPVEPLEPGVRARSGAQVAVDIAFCDEELILHQYINNARETPPPPPPSFQHIPIHTPPYKKFIPLNGKPPGPDSVQSDTTLRESSQDELEEKPGVRPQPHFLELTAARDEEQMYPLMMSGSNGSRTQSERGSYEDILHTIREGSVDFSRAFTSPTSIYGNNSAGARQVGPRLMPAPNTALASGFDVSDPSVGPSPNPR